MTLCYVLLDGIIFDHLSCKVVCGKLDVHPDPLMPMESVGLQVLCDASY